MKLLIDARCFNDSGLGVYLNELLSSFPLDGIEISLLITSELRSSIYSIKSDFDIIEVDFGRFSLKNLFGLREVFIVL